MAQQVGVSLPDPTAGLRFSEQISCTENRLHCGRGRTIPDDIHPQFHESVKHRMDYAPLKYTPRAVWKTGTETYVS